jgi:hypothetical protein
MKYKLDWLLAASGALAVSMALDRMNSDSETPRDRAVSASMSRSRGDKYRVRAPGLARAPCSW